MNNCILEQKKKKKNKIILVISQFMLLLGIIILWESLAYFEIIFIAVFTPSIAALVIPPAYPAPSPAG